MSSAVAIEYHHLHDMASASPIAVAFRLPLRRPLILLAEVAWRWTFAVAAGALAIGLAVEYFDSLHVNTLDRLLLSTGQPVLIAQAIRRIFAGSVPQFVGASLIAALGLAIAWIVLSSIGRLAVLRAIFEELEWEPNSERPFRAILFLNFLRAALVLATKVGAVVRF